MSDIEVRLTGGESSIVMRPSTVCMGSGRMALWIAGFATPSKIRSRRQGPHLQTQRTFPADLLSGEGIDIDGGVWRYHPTKDVFEVVAHGFSNPWGVDYDARGQLFISACVIPHLWHVIPGGIYHRQGGQHFNPYVYSDIKTIADHRHRSAHGGARVYQSDAFPESQRGRIFMANMHEHAVLSDVLVRKGSGFTAKHGHDFLRRTAHSGRLQPREMGLTRGLRVDWHDGDICGKRSTPGDRTHYRSLPRPHCPDLGRPLFRPATMSDRQLVDLQRTAAIGMPVRACILRVERRRAAETGDARATPELFDSTRVRIFDCAPCGRFT